MSGYAVFLDPSGRRWRRLRIAAAVVTVLLVVGLGIGVPRLLVPPELAPGVLPPNLTAADTGTKPPLIGSGPLVRVLRVERNGGQWLGIEPFTQARVAEFIPAEVSSIGNSRYVIQKYGYPAGVRKTISLTFDDGPDPAWTPRLLNLLARERVPATFFVTGKMIAKHPGIIAQEAREGHAVANHSLTHANLSETSAFRARAELTLTDRIVHAATGQKVGFFRLPYESDNDEGIRATVEGLLRGQRWGYVSASFDFDTDDWRAARNGHAIPLPELDGRNVTMLLHDAGGNRQKTLEYVEKQLIPHARSQGYSFHTMPQVSSVLADRTSGEAPSISDRATLALARGVFCWPNQVVRALFLTALVFVVVIGFGNCALAIRRRARRNRTVFPAADQLALPVSVVLAAYNEAPVIARTLRTILASDYPIIEVLVVNDGSKDGTARVVQAVAADDPRVVLLNQANAGKAHALNHGLRQARGEYIMTLDADTMLTRSTITNLVRHFALDREGTLGAVAGVVRVGNRRQNLLTRWQALEYLTQIGVERAAQDALGAISIIPGACAAWRKQAILDVGGYSSATLAEDCDLSLSFHETGWRVTQDDAAIAYTEAPQDVDALLAQRSRWTYGTLQAIWKHRGMLFRRRYGFLGWYVLPSYVLSILAPVIFLPFLVVISVIAVREQGFVVLVMYFALFLIAHVAVAAVGVRLMRERVRHLLMVPIYRIVYEPLRAYLLYTSLYLALRGVRMGWKKLARTGTVDAPRVLLARQTRR